MDIAELFEPRPHGSVNDLTRYNELDMLESARNFVEKIDVKEMRDLPSEEYARCWNRLEFARYSKNPLEAVGVDSIWDYDTRSNSKASLKYLSVGLRVCEPQWREPCELCVATFHALPFPAP